MTLVTTMPEEARSAALLQAVGFDKLNDAQRELALGIANRYGLDPMLKHLVMIEGRPYITRDGLLHVAHKDGALDGIVTTEPILVDGFWRSTCSVYRKDMSHPFTYTGRYPEKGSNAKYAPEMAVKVGEVMALRRAFDVAAPTREEQWLDDASESVTPPPPEPTSLADRVAKKVEAVEAPPPMYEGMPLSLEPTRDQLEAQLAYAEAEGKEREAASLRGEIAATADSGPTLEEFAELVKDVDNALVKRVAKDLFPDVKKYADMTPDQRQTILDRLVVESALEVADPIAPANIEFCGDVSPLSGNTCTLDPGHPSRIHRHGTRESWEHPSE